MRTCKICGKPLKKSQTKTPYCSLECIANDEELITSAKDPNISASKLSKMFNTNRERLATVLVDLNIRKLYTNKIICPRCGKLFYSFNQEYCSRKCARWVPEEQKKAVKAEAKNRRRAKQKSSTPGTADKRLIKLIYMYVPKGYHVDHIIPINKGGLHHQDNLQYLPRSENSKKGDSLEYQPKGIIKWQDIILSLDLTKSNRKLYHHDMITLKAPLKWAGGKKWFVPILKKMYNPSCRFVEPFVGGASLVLGLKPERALLNDINTHVINLYQKISEGLVIDTELLNDKDYYLQSRDKFNYLIENNQSDTKEAAELFYYLNRTCFNGLCRFNKSGKFNVPFGKYKTINYAKHFLQYKLTFKNYEFVSKDFSELEIKENDFIYADPPYDDSFTGYSAKGFTWKDQERLVEWLDKYNNPVVISNRATDRIIDLYKNFGYEIEIVKAPRRISSNGNRLPVDEVVAYKHLAEN